LLCGFDIAAIQLILNGLQQAARHRLFRPHGAACYQFLGRVKVELSGSAFCAFLPKNVPKSAAIQVRLCAASRRWRRQCQLPIAMPQPR
jgi:hypothetical protein